MPPHDADIDLTCWYLNQRRLLELFGADHGLPQMGRNFHLLPYLQQLAAHAALKQAAIQHIVGHGIPPLGKLLLQPHVDLSGQFFTHYTNFFFKGVTRLRGDRDGALDPAKTASGYAKLDTVEPNLRLEFNFHPSHLTSSSAWGELSGQKRKFLFGVVQEALASRIVAIPYLIGDLLVAAPARSLPSSGVWLHHRELHIDQLNCFEAASNVRLPRSVADLQALANIPEREIKRAFAEIIGEPVVPQDWPGERSDLFSTHVRARGQRISTAFIFKGPAKFQPMTMAHLGKNGDQIDRLFSEPADLLILQHCHQITPPVRSSMRAYAQQIGRPRLYCVIDGFDTLRILQAYRKCGLTPTARRGPKQAPKLLSSRAP